MVYICISLNGHLHEKPSQMSFILLEYNKIMIIGQRKAYKNPTHSSVGNPSLTSVKASSLLQSQEWLRGGLSQDVNAPIPTQDDKSPTQAVAVRIENKL